jgi:hypothetical protein
MECGWYFIGNRSKGRDGKDVLGERIRPTCHDSGDEFGDNGYQVFTEWEEYNDGVKIAYY